MSRIQAFFLVLASSATGAFCGAPGGLDRLAEAELRAGRLEVGTDRDLIEVLLQYEAPDAARDVSVEARASKDPSRHLRDRHRFRVLTGDPGPSEVAGLARQAMPKAKGHPGWVGSLLDTLTWPDLDPIREELRRRQELAAAEASYPGEAPPTWVSELRRRVLGDRVEVGEEGEGLAQLARSVVAEVVSGRYVEQKLSGFLGSLARAVLGEDQIRGAIRDRMDRLATDLSFAGQGKLAREVRLAARRSWGAKADPLAPLLATPPAAWVPATLDRFRLEVLRPMEARIAGPAPLDRSAVCDLLATAAVLTEARRFDLAASLLDRGRSRLAASPFRGLEFQAWLGAARAGLEAERGQPGAAAELRERARRLRGHDLGPSPVERLARRLDDRLWLATVCPDRFLAPLRAELEELETGRVAGVPAGEVLAMAARVRARGAILAGELLPGGWTPSEDPVERGLIDMPRAVELMSEAVRLGPEGPDAVYLSALRRAELGILLAESGDLAAAARRFDEATRLARTQARDELLEAEIADLRSRALPPPKAQPVAKPGIRGPSVPAKVAPGPAPEPGGGQPPKVADPGSWLGI